MAKQMRSKLTGVVFPYHAQRLQANPDFYEEIIEDAVPSPPKRRGRGRKAETTVDDIVGDLNGMDDS